MQDFYGISQEFDPGISPAQTVVIEGGMSN